MRMMSRLQEWLKDARLTSAQQEIRRLTEELETERSRTRIQEEEIKQLAAVIARDRARVEAETRKLSGKDE